MSLRSITSEKINFINLDEYLNVLKFQQLLKNIEIIHTLIKFIYYIKLFSVRFIRNAYNLGLYFIYAYSTPVAAETNEATHLKVKAVYVTSFNRHGEPVRPTLNSTPNRNTVLIDQEINKLTLAFLVIRTKKTDELHCEDINASDTYSCYIYLIKLYGNLVSLYGNNLP